MKYRKVKCTFAELYIKSVQKDIEGAYKCKNPEICKEQFDFGGTKMCGSPMLELRITTQDDIDRIIKEVDGSRRTNEQRRNKK